MLKRKKLLALCMALLLALSAMSPMALALDSPYVPSSFIRAAGTVHYDNCVFSVVDTDIPEQGTAVMPIVVTGNEGFAGLELDLTFDHELFTVKSISRGDFSRTGSVNQNKEYFNSGEASYLKCMMTSTRNIFADGTVFLVELEVKEGVELGSYPVRMTYNPSNTLFHVDNDRHSLFYEIMGITTLSGTLNVVHNWDEGKPVESTCIPGTYDTLYTCTVCGATRIEPGIDAHPWEVTSRQEPTCTENGAILYTCPECHRTRSDILEPLGHDYVAETTPPTCTEDGVITYTCSRCDDTYTEAGAPATGHTVTHWEHVDDDTHKGNCDTCGAEVTAAHNTASVYTPPTCTEDGFTTVTCADCGWSYTREGSEDPDVDWHATGHSFGDWQPDGEENHIRHCANCDETETAPHTFHAGEAVEPTCTEDGYTPETCDECGYAHNINVIPALGHNYEVVEVVEPTEEAGGYTVYKCTRCDDTYNADFTDPLPPSPPPVTVLKGDVDDNKVVDNADLVMLARYMVKLEETLPSMVNADMDDSQEINNQDLVALARLLVGIK